ncbi:hypothetical protein PHMEG_0005952 [Phytophthora megakarya]|uniref:Endo-beta-1,6-galactanase-like domain-containing protein n=1 Tax=Phytophthora megakarya TaxID=4795 RepID=A0A225WRT5_9STRA|nr:hypothetical protein PHMEG_0005952 [Phytophthora megakarya]
MASISTADSPVYGGGDTTPKITVTRSSTETVWEGWGTSLAWWTNVYGDSEDLAELFFSLNPNPLVETSASVLDLPALGFNIVRYNIGGSSNNVIDDGGEEIAMKTSKEMLSYKTMESYWLDWFSKDPSSKSWNWDADAKQRKMLSLATGHGVNVLEAYSNSPPWWMTKNRATAGGDKGTEDNLVASYIDQFALYLATVVSEAKTRWDVTFNYIEPFNEPMSSTWEFPATQEGCHFEIATQNEVVSRLRFHLDQLKLQDVKVSVSDENSPTQALESLTRMSENVTVTKSVGKVNTHGNDGTAAYRGSDRVALRKLVSSSSLKLWDSNYVDDDATGLTLAQSISLDINEMGVSAFIYDQVLNTGVLGLIQSNPWDNWMGEANPKYYVMAHYSRHVRPGMEIHASDDPNVVVAFDSEKYVLVIIRVNSGAAETKKVNIEEYNPKMGRAIDNWPSRIDTWTTKMNGTDSFYVESGVQKPSLEFNIDFPAASITSMEVHWPTPSF